ncbi:MAG: hypothetical protein ACP5P3_10595, partial [Ignavibacteria bacterium]
MTLKNSKINSLSDHPVITLLKSFSDDELKKFRRFLQSPYFNTGSKVIDLYNLLCKFYPDFKSKLLNKETLYFRLHNGKKKYKDSTMRDLLSELLDLMQKFLTLENFDKNCPVKFEYLSTELINKRQVILITRLLKSTESELVSNTIFDTYDYYALHRFYLMKFNSNFTHGNLADTDINKSNLIQVINSTNNLLFFFISEYISEYINMIVYALNFNIPMPSNLWIDSIDF